MGRSQINGEAPRDLDAERAVLGSVLLDPNVLPTLMEILVPGEFYHAQHGRVFECMVALWSIGTPIDAVTVSAETKRLANGIPAAEVPFLYGLTEQVATAANARHYASVVKGLAVRRALMDVGCGLATRAVEAPTHEAALEEAQRSVLALARSQIKDDGARPAGEVANAAYRHLVAIHDGTRPITGVRTGFERLDYMTCGLQAGELAVIAGRPSMGKSSLALAIARNSGVRGLLFSLEMSRDSIGLRLLAMESGIDMHRARSGRIRPEEWATLSAARADLDALALEIDDTAGLSISQVRMRARIAATGRATPLGLVIVDYLQLVRAPWAERREAEVAEISGGLKALAKELAVPVVALSQLNRALEGRAEKRPTLGDLRESGALEQDADIVLFCYRDEYYNPKTTKDAGIAEVIIGKQRNGPIGRVKLRFDAGCTAFREPEPALFPAAAGDPEED